MTEKPFLRSKGEGNERNVVLLHAQKQSQEAEKEYGTGAMMTMVEDVFLAKNSPGV